MPDDDFKPPTAADVTDLALLPQLLRMHVAEVKDSLDTFGRKLDLILGHLKDVIRRQDDHDRRISALEPPPYVPKVMRGRGK
jgi:hypothetical protein